MKNKPMTPVTFEIDVYMTDTKYIKKVVEKLQIFFEKLGLYPDHIMATMPIELPDLPPSVVVSGIDFTEEDFPN